MIMMIIVMITLQHVILHEVWVWRNPVGPSVRSLLGIIVVGRSSILGVDASHDSLHDASHDSLFGNDTFADSILLVDVAFAGSILLVDVAFADSILLVDVAFSHGILLVDVASWWLPRGENHSPNHLGITPRFGLLSHHLLDLVDLLRSGLEATLEVYYSKHPTNFAFSPPKIKKVCGF